MATINMNDTVLVRLTDAGKSELTRQLNELKKEFNGVNFGPAFRIDDNGYSKFQLHTLMSSLGHMCTTGGELPFDTEIQHNNG